MTTDDLKDPALCIKRTKKSNEKLTICGQDGRMENQAALIARLQDHIAKLEAELARYGHRYGLTEAARELLKRPVE